MDNEKLKLYLDFAKFFLGTFLIALITFIVKSGFESREIAIKESEQIGKYVEIALREDVGVRKRFAEYFQTVTISDRYRNRWRDYYELVNGEFVRIKSESDTITKQIDFRKKMLAKFKDSSDAVKEKYFYEIDSLEKEKAIREDELDVKPDEIVPETYQIVLHSVNPGGASETIKKYIEEQGFNLNRDIDYENKPNWMSEGSVIVYYSPVSRFAAKSMASNLRQLTGKSFTIKLASGPGGQRRQDYNFAIYYIN